MEKYLTKSKTLVLLDAGHGSDTPGKRSPIWSDGKQLFEWAYNRVIVRYIKDYLKLMGVSYVDIVTENNDISLTERVERANSIYIKHKDDYELIYLISIHGNAAKNEKANGIEVFTSIGQTMADPIAEMLYKELKKIGWRMRKDVQDGDNDKEAKFKMLTDTIMPAVLSENGFYTNEEECHRMMKFEWNMEVARAHYRTIFEIEKIYVRKGSL